MCSLALPAMAFAQPESPKVEEDVTMGIEPVVEEPMTEEEVEDVAEEAAEEAVEEAMEEASPFRDNISWMVMASAFYRVGGYLDDGVVAGAYNDAPYPYTNYNGFGLNFVGGDFQYTGEKFGIRIDLRFGEGASLLTPISSGFGGLKQGYVSWMPSDKVTFDFGFFDTVFGGEVVDEWNNANFTRGALYFLRQPFNHMGLRAAFAFTDNFGFTLLVTNGGVLGGGAIDNNETPTIGWQFSLGGDNVGFYFGGQHGAGNDNDNKNWENFFDWVLTANAGIFGLVLNGDYQLLPTAVTGAPSGAFAYGHSIQIFLDPTDKFGIGIRGEHLSGDEDYRNFAAGIDHGLVTATLTLRYKPVEYLVLSLEGRAEWNTREIYNARSTILGEGDQKKQNYAAIVGFTAYIGN
jgi:hypothetical protein